MGAAPLDPLPAEPPAAVHSRAIQLAIVSFSFAILGALTAGELGPAPGLLAAELGVSLTAAGLLLGTLIRGRSGTHRERL